MRLQRSILHDRKQSIQPLLPNEPIQVGLNRPEVRRLGKVAGDVDLVFGFREGGHFDSGKDGHAVLLEGREGENALDGIVIGDRHAAQVALLALMEEFLYGEFAIGHGGVEMGVNSERVEAGPALPSEFCRLGH